MIFDLTCCFFVGVFLFVDLTFEVKLLLAIDFYRIFAVGSPASRKKTHHRFSLMSSLPTGRTSQQFEGF